MRRCIVFAHYDRDRLIDDYVLYLLASLRKHAEQLVFVSVSATPEQLLRLHGICDVAVARENIGYDFMSWKLGLQYIRNLDIIDEVLFVNDSIYGPLCDLRRLFERSDLLPADFWGLTRCHEIRPHIQSFFFAFRRRLIDSGIFDAFWSTVSSLSDKREIIRRYEVGMTEFIEQRGGRVGQLYDQQGLSLHDRLQAILNNGRHSGKSLFQVARGYLTGKTTNPMHFNWCGVIDAGIPFLKVELMRDNPRGMSHTAIRRYLEQRTDYNQELINSHLRRVTRPADPEASA